MMFRSPFALEALELRLCLAVITVTNNNDSGGGSLRAALAAAGDGDTIDLTGRSGTITLSSGQLNVDDNVSILGPGADALTVSGGDDSRVFKINSGTAVSMSDLRISDGAANSGAGISADGNLVLTGVVIVNCAATDEGGGIDSNGALTMIDCTISNNTSQKVGGGINVYNVLTMNRCTVANNSAQAPVAFDEEMEDFAGFGRGAGLTRWQGNTSLTNCTFTGNTASGENTAGGDPGSSQGAGIYIDGAGSFTMLNCTVARNNNVAANSSAAGVYFAAGSGSRVITNSIIAGNNSASGEKDFATAMAATSGGNNLIGRIGSGSVFVNGVSGDKVGTNGSPIDPKLDDLGDNGGETETLALIGGSPAINAGSTAEAPATDQRGQSRVGTADIGAFEFSSVNNAPTITSTEVTSVTTRTQYVYGITATDQNDDDLAITATGLPAWLTLTDHGDGTASLVGTPAVTDAGNYNVNVRVSDGLANDQQPFTISVVAPRFHLGSDGILVIAGDDGANDISVWTRGEDQLRVVRDGTTKNFSIGDITRIEVWGLDSNDIINVNTRTLGAYVAGGDGNDRIICGDEGDTVSGGAGKDFVDGGGGHDRLNGNGGNDILVAGAGLDRLFGGAGNDRLVAQPEPDQLRGEAGNDILYARNTVADLLIGGDGDDLAEVDDVDVQVDALTILA